MNSLFSMLLTSRSTSLLQKWRRISLDNTSGIDIRFSSGVLLWHSANEFNGSFRLGSLQSFLLGFFLESLHLTETHPGIPIRAPPVNIPGILPRIPSEIPSVVLTKNHPQIPSWISTEFPSGISSKTQPVFSSRIPLEIPRREHARILLEVLTGIHSAMAFPNSFKYSTKDCLRKCSWHTSGNSYKDFYGNSYLNSFWDSFGMSPGFFVGFFWFFSTASSGSVSRDLFRYSFRNFPHNFLQKLFFIISQKEFSRYAFQDVSTTSFCDFFLGFSSIHSCSNSEISRNFLRDEWNRDSQTCRLVVYFWKKKFENFRRSSHPIIWNFKRSSWQWNPALLTSRFLILSFLNIFLFFFGK